MVNKILLRSPVWLNALLIAMLSTLTLLSTSAMAQRASKPPAGNLPSYYPASYQQTGVIHEIGLDNTLVISGLKYQLSSSTKIHTVTTQFASTWPLKVNEEVGFTFTTDASNKRSISEIWLLPTGSIVLH
jgi:hypothetical protein